MASVTKNLFLKIAADFDATGTNQALEIFGKLQDSLNQLSSFAVNNTVKAFAEWETQLVQVRRTTGFTQSEIDGLGKSLLNMSTQTGQSVNELTKIAGVGGLLGVAGSELGAFTTVVNESSIAWNANSEAVALALAKITAGFQLGTSEDALRRISDTVNSLGNTTAASATNISDFLQQASGSFRQFGFDIEEAAALGAIAIEQGFDPSDTATRFASAFDFMVKKADKAAVLFGISSDEFKTKINNDMFGTLVALIEKIEEIPGRAQRMEILTDIFGRVGKKGVLALVGNLDRLNVVLGTSVNKTFKVADEFEIAMDTMARKVGQLTQGFRNFGIVIGKEVADSTKPFLDKLIDLSGAILNFALNNSATVKTLAEFTIGIGILATGLAGITGLIGTWSLAVSGVGLVIGSVVSGLTSLANGLLFLQAAGSAGVGFLSSISFTAAGMATGMVALTSGIASVGLAFIAWKLAFPVLDSLASKLSEVFIDPNEGRVEIGDRVNKLARARANARVEGNQGFLDRTQDEFNAARGDNLIQKSLEEQSAADIRSVGNIQQALMEKLAREKVARDNIKSSPGKTAEPEKAKKEKEEADKLAKENALRQKRLFDQQMAQQRRDEQIAKSFLQRPGEAQARFGQVSGFEQFSQRLMEIPKNGSQAFMDQARIFNNNLLDAQGRTELRNEGRFQLEQQIRGEELMANRRREKRLEDEARLRRVLVQTMINRNAKMMREGVKITIEQTGDRVVDAIVEALKVHVSGLSVCGDSF